MYPLHAIEKETTIVIKTEVVSVGTSVKKIEVGTEIEVETETEIEIVIETEIVTETEIEKEKEIVDEEEVVMLVM